MDFNIFDSNRKHYGLCASWAVWKIGACERMRYAPDSDKAPKLFLNRAVETLNSISSQTRLDESEWQLNPQVVLVALNFADRDEAVQEATNSVAFHAFHEETSTTSDHRLRDVCCGTPLWGGYITDLVKIVDGQVQPLRNSNASDVMKLLKSDRFRHEQVAGFVEELKQLNVSSPTIIAMGNDVHRVLSRPEVAQQLHSELGPETKVLKITHYSKTAGFRHHDFVKRVYGELRDQKFM